MACGVIGLPDVAIEHAEPIYVLPLDRLFYKLAHYKGEFVGLMRFAKCKLRNANCDRRIANCEPLAYEVSSDQFQMIQELIRI